MQHRYLSLWSDFSVEFTLYTKRDSTSTWGTKSCLGKGRQGSGQICGQCGAAWLLCGELMAMHTHNWGGIARQAYNNGKL